jgi:beta-aspartyl-peptidase (threonine type)
MNDAPTPIIVGSANASVGFGPAVEILAAGGTALDAVITAIRHVEANPDDHSVGYGGLPNLLGEVELDASIMEGRGRRAGAVGALQGYQDAVDLARAVMEELPHVIIVTAGAARLAHELGFTPKKLLTPEAEAIWREELSGELSTDAANSSGRSVYLERVRALVSGMTRDPELPEPPHGTVNVIALDSHGDLVSGVSTSGWAWKYPGRLGDSPIIGAGNYADNRYGAAACTGRGEMALRASTAHSVVMAMRFGQSLTDAIRFALEDVRTLDDPYASELNVVALTPDGHHAAGSTTKGKTYIWQRADMKSAVEEERQYVPLRAAVEMEHVPD